ncbi:hypothetical protein NT6N_32750 [Oceaniferula spumae]|uniref:Lipoprotein n=1 Tax=Oceaniferula spumae TaxID=2979115 RepID=A0AAT9FQE6_9BACT
MKTKLLLLASAAIIPLTLPSCDPGVYYGGTYGSGYSSGGYVSSLPYGYQTVHVSGNPYYYHNNVWYRRSNGRYIRCSRPHGYRGSLGGHHSGHGHISHLPSGYRSHTIRGSRYYSHGNSWYQRRDGKYYRVSRPSSYHPSSKPSWRSNDRGRSDYRGRGHTSINPGIRSGVKPQISSPRNTNMVVSRKQPRVTPSTSSRSRGNSVERKKPEAKDFFPGGRSRR